MTEYVLNQHFSTRTPRSPRVLALAEAFGLGLEEREFWLFKDLKLDVSPGDVIFITGQSGSGKSQLLRALRDAMTAGGLKVADIDQVTFDEDKTLIDQMGATMQQSLELLSRAGINDAYLAIRKPRELSDGQRYRLRLAKLFEAGESADAWICDEFGAILDRTTAKVVAFSAQKLARALKKTLIVATTHTDLSGELGPSITIEKRYQERILVTRNNVDE